MAAMTHEQWLALKVGDVIIDHKCRDARRTVLTITRVSGKPGQRGNTRTCIRVDNIKSPGQRTVIFSTDDSPNYSRFSLEVKP